MRKIKLFFVTDNCDTIGECLNNVHTVVKDKHQARVYLNNLIYFNKQSHYERWCEIHNEKSDDLDTFYRYLDILGEDPFSEYKIFSMKFPVDKLCSMLRQLTGCVPLGLYYEPEDELQYFFKQYGNEQKNDEVNENK